MDFRITYLLLAVTAASCVEVHFESPDGGFFLKPSTPPPSGPRKRLHASSGVTSSLNPDRGGDAVTGGGDGSGDGQTTLSVDRFAVFRTQQPISVRATYGPFSTKQTVPSKFIVPDPLEPIPISVSSVRDSARDPRTQFELRQPRHLDMSAHLVAEDVPRDSPVLRVLFHADSASRAVTSPLSSPLTSQYASPVTSPVSLPIGSSHAGSGTTVTGADVCVAVHVTLKDKRMISAACKIGREGVCLAQVTIPHSWWPALPPPESHGKPSSPRKSPPRLLRVSYSVLHAAPQDARSSDGTGSEDGTADSLGDGMGEGGPCEGRVQIQPPTLLGNVPLVPARAAYKELRADKALTMLVPHSPLYPLSRIHVPVFLQTNTGQNGDQSEGKLDNEIRGFVIRARVKAGLRILSATSYNEDWHINFEVNAKRTVATVTADKRSKDIRKDTDRKDEIHQDSNSVQEVFSWLLEASDDSSDLWDGGRITWSVRYATDIGSAGDETSPNEHSGEGAANRRIRRHHFLTRRDSGDRDYIDTSSEDLESTKQSETSTLEKQNFRTDNYDEDSEESINKKEIGESVTHKSKVSKNKKYVQQKGTNGKEKHHSSEKIELRYSSVDDEGHVVERKTILDEADVSEIESTKLDDEEVLMEEQYSTDEELITDDDLETTKGALSATEKYTDKSSSLEGNTEGISSFESQEDIATESSSVRSHDRIDVASKRKEKIDKQQRDAEREEGNSRRKLTAKLEILKDDIQSVLPISKKWELVNTAMLTGRQVSQPMKVFIVTHAGQIADVTLQSSCQAQDESVLKVSSSCSSVYLDGSESRGAISASIAVTYGRRVGRARYRIWAPHTPLDVSVADPRLALVKGWRVPPDSDTDLVSLYFSHSAPSIKSSLGSGSGRYRNSRRRKRSYSFGSEADGRGTSAWNNGLHGNGHQERTQCRARYQQTTVSVHARFSATDPDSGRVTHLLGRRAWLRVTDLVLPLLRVSDPRVAALKGRTLLGLAAGRCEVQAVSPVTGRVMGAREVRVAADRVAIAGLRANVVSGLQLRVSAASDSGNGWSSSSSSNGGDEYIAETSVTRKLTAQYQEGLLDLDVVFSDGSVTPLRDIDRDAYSLRVQSLDSEVVAFAPMLGSAHPRVIAVGEGSGDLLRVTLLLNEQCRPRSRHFSGNHQRPGTPLPPLPHGAVLAEASVDVQVDFAQNDIGDVNHWGNRRTDAVQNDSASRRKGRGQNNMDDLQDILINIPLRDSAQTGLGLTSRSARPRSSPRREDLSSLEIGMYVLLAALCFAIVVFVVSCVVYASRLKPAHVGGGVTVTPVTRRMSNINGNGNRMVSSGVGASDNNRDCSNAHDWVWLGRTTMDDRDSTHIMTRDDHVNGNNVDMRIIDNPMSINYCEPGDSVNNQSGQQQRIIDSATYCKKDRVKPPIRHSSNDVGPPVPPHGVGRLLPEAPPLPPHGIPLRHHHHSNNGMANNHHRSSHHQVIDNHHHQMSNNMHINAQEEYRPPVPPHRNISKNDNKKTIPETVALPRRHHHKHRNNNHHQNQNGNHAHNNRSHVQVEDNARPGDATNRFDELIRQKNAFEFDEDVPTVNKNLPKPKPEPSQAEPAQVMLDSGIGLSEISKTSEQLVRKNSSVECDQDNSMQFIENKEGNPIAKPRNSVKRATIVGNPMFSNNDNTLSSQDSNDIENPGESLGLDDLDMDYEQIMHYFDNLKESNA